MWLHGAVRILRDRVDFLEKELIHQTGQAPILASLSSDTLVDSPVSLTEIRRPMGIVLADLVQGAPGLILPTWSTYFAGESGNSYSTMSVPHGEHG